MMDPYEHEHTGIIELSWQQVGDILRSMAVSIGNDWRPDIVIGIAKGGAVAGVLLGSAFMVDFFPIKLSSRHNEQVINKEPEWYVYPTAHVKDKKVLVVDDICIAGRTFSKAIDELKRMGATEIRTASIAMHSGSIRPDYVGLVTDDCVVWPWDRDVLTKDGEWNINPEYLSEINRPGRQSS